MSRGDAIIADLRAGFGVEDVMVRWKVVPLFVATVIAGVPGLEAHHRIAMRYARERAAA